MNIVNMIKEDFAAVPYLDLYNNWKELAPKGYFKFRSFVIIPVEDENGIELHDSGWGCMEFCLVNDNHEPIGKVGGGSDVIHLDGIGGHGSHRVRGFGLVYHELPKLIPVKGWCIDCLPCGYLNVWTKKTLYLEDPFICSSMEIYSEE